MVQFNPRSQSRLQGVDPRLVQVLNLAKQQSGLNFEISEGLRDTERQKKLVAEGKSQTLNSRHLHGKAVDVHLLNDDGTANWDFEAYRPLAVAMKSAAQQLGYDDLVWGGDWKTLKDGVHFQIGGPEQAASPGPSVIGRGSNAQIVQGNQVSRAADGLLGGQQMAEQPQQRGLRGLLSDPDKRDRLILALEGMTLNPNVALQQAAAQGLQERGQQRQQQAQAGRTADFLRARGRADLADAVEAGLPAADALRTALSPAPDDRTALIKNYEFAVEQGFEGSLTDFQNATKTGTNITVNTGAETSRFGPAPEGTVWVLDEQGDNVMETDPVSGKPRPVSVPLSGSAAEKRAAELAKAGGVNEAAAERAGDSMRLIDSIINDPALESITGMIQGRLPPMTQAGTDLNVKIDQLKGQAFLQAFETLKGGGQITEREGIAAQNAIARLDRVQGTPAYRESLAELRAIAERGMRRARGEDLPDLYADTPATRAGGQATSGQVTNATGNIAVDPELLQFMTPEERALFE